MIEDPNVYVSVKGRDYTLSPTDQAIRTVIRSFDGVEDGFAKCGKLSADAFVTTITAGAGLKPKERKDLDGAILRTTLDEKTEIATAVIDFIVICFNGGTRPAASDDEPEDLGNDGPVPPPTM